MVRHIDSELECLKDLTLQMGGSVEKALSKVASFLTSRDSSSAREVVSHEARINDLQILIDESCVNVLAQQAPVAKDLRFVIAVTRINTDLERMGDQCVNIIRLASDLSTTWPNQELPSQLVEMIEGVRHMVESSLNSFSKRDIELSRQVLEQDDRIDDLKDELIDVMRSAMQKSPQMVDVGLALIMIGKNLERVADHATNIAEEVIYLATGDDIRHGQHRSSVSS